MGKFTKAQIKTLDEIAARTPTVPVFENDSPQKKLERLERSKEDSWDGFKFTAETYFPHICTKPFAAAHKEMFNLILAHPRALTALTGTRALAKTTLTAIIFVIWKFMQGWQFNVQVAGDIDLSEARAAFIHNELANNVRLLHDYPKLAPAGADPSNFHLKNKALVMARSIMMGIHGLINPRTAKRPDLIIMDDIDDEKNQGNATIGKKKLDKITGSVTGSVNPDLKKESYVIWLGNLNHPNYAICQFEREMELAMRESGEETGPRLTAGRRTSETHVPTDSEQAGTHVPSDSGQAGTHVPTGKKSGEGVDEEMKRQGNHIISRNRVLLRYPLINAKGKSIWEAQFPTSEIPALRAKMGMVSFQREMLGKAVIEGKVFHDAWFNTYTAADISPEKMKMVVLYADPARGSKGSFKAIGAVGWDGSRYFMLRCWIRQTDQNAFFERYYNDFTNLLQTYGYRFQASMETVFGQQYILVDLDRWCKDNGHQPISHLIRRIENKENKNTRIERLETVIQSGALLFCGGQDFETLKLQFLTYPDGYLDGPDMTAGCLERFGSYKYGRNSVRVRKFGG